MEQGEIVDERRQGFLYLILAAFMVVALRVLRNPVNLVLFVLCIWNMILRIKCVSVVSGTMVKRITPD